VSEKHYDTIVIGSGPISILEAIHLKIQGKKVIIIDERDEIGGAWGTIKYEGFPELEIGCHIWDLAPGVFDFLQTVLGLEMKNMSPAPKIQKGSKRFPYDWKMNMLTVKHSLKRSAQLKFRTLASDLKTPGYRLSILPPKYLYPINGAIDVKHALEDMLKKHDIPVLHTRLARLDIDKRITAQLSNSETITADQIALTSLSNIDEIRFNNQVQAIDVKPVRYIHFHLVIKDPQPTNFSYVRVMGNQLIHRVSDMSRQAPDVLNKDEKLICVGIYEHEFDKHPANELGNLLFQQLQVLNFVSKNGSLRANHHNVFHAPYADKVAVRKIESESNGQLKFLHSTNLTYGIHNQLPRWKDLLNTSTK